MPHITPRLSVEGPDAEGNYDCALDIDCYDYYFGLTRAEADALIAALNPWRDIASAPKDAGFLLAYNADRKVYGLVCWWPGGGFNGEGCWCWSDSTIAWSRHRGNQPTHWQPLPAAPVAP